MAFALLLLAVLVPAFVAEAQTAPLASGIVLPNSAHLYNDGNGDPLGTCPSDFFSASTTNPAVCYSATMTCSNPQTTPNLDFIYSYDNPGSPKGTIVFFPDATGELGTVKDDNEFAQDYFNDGYEIVQVAWTTEWEKTSDPLGIMTAACRPAGFINYVLNTPLLNARSTQHPANGLCAQGSSAGSGALGYALAWYLDQSGNYLNTDLDNVELISGPVFGNIELGCEVVAGGQHAVVPICYPGQQYGCSTGTTGWGSPSDYKQGYVTGVRNWTNDPSCNNGVITTQSSNQKWLAMSIVNGTGGNFTYQNLGLAGWLCASSTTNSCGASCPNNSAGQGEQFYSQIAGSSQATAYKLTGILGCNGAENVTGGTDPDPNPPGCTPGVNCLAPLTGKQAFELHMTTQCKHPSPH